MLKRGRTFLKAKGGLAAIEFALIGPLLATMLMGTIEMCNALSCKQKVAMLASASADLVAQTASISSSGMTDVFNAVTAIVYPFSATGTKIVISSVMSDGNGNGTVAWSETQNGTALAVNSAVTLPQPIMSTCDSTGACVPCAKNACSVILAQVSYAYTSPVASFLIGTINMTDYFYARPRKSVSVAYTG